MTDQKTTEQLEAGLQEQMAAALMSPDVPKIYCNGFINATTHADCIIVLKRNNESVAVINASYTLTKTLAQSLTKMVEEFERTIQTKLKTTSEIDEAKSK
jgi:hypothetical protein